MVGTTVLQVKPTQGSLYEWKKAEGRNAFLENVSKL
jgi:hypothetical protein